MEGLGIGLFGLACGVVAGAAGASGCWQAFYNRAIAVRDEQTRNWHRLWERENNKLHAVREWCHQGHKVQLRDKKGRLGKKEFVRVLLDKELKAAGYGSL